MLWSKRTLTIHFLCSIQSLFELDRIIYVTKRHFVNLGKVASVLKFKKLTKNHLSR